MILNKISYICNMAEKVLITGVTIQQETKKAKAILAKEIIPQSKEYRRRQKAGVLEFKVPVTVKHA